MKNRRFGAPVGIFFAIVAVLVPFKLTLVQILVNCAIITLCGLFLLMLQLGGKFWGTLLNQKILIFGLLFTALSIITVHETYQRRLTNRNLYNYDQSTHPIGRAWQALEELPKGSVIAQFGYNKSLYYPPFGRELQFIPLSLLTDGTLYTPLHQRWSENPDQSRWWHWRELSSMNTLENTLIEQEVDYLLIARCNQGKWLSFQQVLNNSERMRSIYNDEYSCIWKIRH
jgi:hypothetical protein